MTETILTTDLAQRFPTLSAAVLNTQDEQPSGQMDMMQAPDPVGHFMLVALPEVEIRTKSGIYIPDTVSDRERAASVVGTVIAMGPDCYKDPEPKLPTDLPPGTPITVLAARPRFPSGPWCKQGDTVLFSRYAGKRFTIEGVEFRMLSDDEITATIPDGAKVGGL
jgi:co-chaperonin GroES (HSP10)